jgi:antitoxin HigA-1
MNLQRKSAERESGRQAAARQAAVHPGEFLRDDFLSPMGLSANALAMALRVPVTRISEILRERRGITADTALRLARYFGTTPDFWMKMQVSYDLALASSHAAVRIYAEVIPVTRERGDGKIEIAVARLASRLETKTEASLERKARDKRTKVTA